MKCHLLIVAFLITTLTCSTQAGTWEPNPEKVYSFDANHYTSYGLSQSDSKWIASLLKKLRKHGTVKAYTVFVKTNLKLNLNANPLSSFVYVGTKDNRFLSFEENSQSFMIDFENQRVFIPYGGGVSFHQQHKKQFVVAVSSASNKVRGVPISSGGKKPVFKEKSVTWY